VNVSSRGSGSRLGLGLEGLGSIPGDLRRNVYGLSARFVLNLYSDRKSELAQKESEWIADMSTDDEQPLASSMGRGKRKKQKVPSDGEQPARQASAKNFNKNKKMKKAWQCYHSYESTNLFITYNQPQIISLLQLFAIEGTEQWIRGLGNSC